MRAIALLACLCTALPILAQPAPAGPDTLAPSSAEASDPVPYDFQRLVVRRKPDPPTYPPLARLARLQGAVHLRLTIQASGQVLRAEALDGPALLRTAAAAYLRAWSFEPVLVDGKPVPVQCDLQVPFRLDGVSSGPPAPQPSKVVVEIEQTPREGASVLRTDRLAAELADFLDRSGLRQVPPSEAGPQDTFLLKFWVRMLRVGEVSFCQVRTRGSLWEARDLAENEPGKPARIAFLNRVAGQKGEVDLPGMIAGTLRQEVEELLSPPLRFRAVEVVSRPRKGGDGAPAVAPRKDRTVDFDFSQIRVKYQPPAPPYPIEAKLARVQGTVVLSLIIDPKGEPVRVDAEEGPVPLLSTAIAYALAWRFEPALLNGVPQYARFKLTMPFRLR
jgi:TonB family protein